MRKLFLILLLFPLFCTRCYAENVQQEAAEILEAEQVESGLGETEKEITGQLRTDGSYDAQDALKRLWEWCLAELKEKSGEEIHFALGTFAIASFCSIGSILCEGKSIGTLVEIAGCCAIVMRMTSGMDGIIEQAVNTLYQIMDYSRAAMPALYTAAAACGAVTTATARYAACSLAMDIVMSVAEHLILPLIYAFLAIAICGSLFENPILKAFSQALKWAATTAMTGVTLAFGAYIGLTGIVTGSTDAAAVKTARTVLSSTLPVVGGILADSASVVMSAASVIRNAVGVFGLIAVSALCAGPFVLLTVKMYLYKALSILTDMLPTGRISRLIGNLGTAYALLLGLIGCCAAMLFISFMAGIRAVAL